MGCLRLMPCNNRCGGGWWSDRPLVLVDVMLRITLKSQHVTVISSLPCPTYDNINKILSTKSFPLPPSGPREVCCCDKTLGKVPSVFSVFS